MSLFAFLLLAPATPAFACGVSGPDGASSCSLAEHEEGGAAARGCGQNLYYDLSGRLLGEAAVSCSEAQPTQLLPAATDRIPAGSVALGLTSGAVSVTARYFFDAYPSWGTGLLGSGGAGTRGRATAASDAAQRSVLVYDPRGNAIRVARQIALPTAPLTLVGSGGTPTGSAAYPYSSKPAFDTSSELGAALPEVQYDTARTYVRTAVYDHGSRNVRVGLPDDPALAAGSAPRIEGNILFHRTGAVRRAELGIDGIFRSVVDNIAYTYDGLPARVRFGDGAFTGRAATDSATLYDVRRRPIELLTRRAPASGQAAGSLPAVTVVADQRLSWDGANNLIAVEDRRVAAEWPAGQKPANQRIYHDALYRVARVDYSYATANQLDSANPWRPELARRAPNDAMLTSAAPVVANDSLAAVPNRSMSFVYSHDWLANMIEWTDDAHVFYERSLGPELTNGSTLSGSSATPAYRPSALYLASNFDSAVQSDLGGWLEADYGKGGNLLALTVHARCTNAPSNTCVDPGGSDYVSRRAAINTRCRCAREQYYVYRWDQSNRLAEARRYDAADQTGWLLAARQRYVYDGSNVRTIKQKVMLGSQLSLGNRSSLYVFGGDFERRGVIQGATGWEPTADGLTETQYMIAGSRVVWKNRNAPGAVIDPQHRITVALTNLIGSTNAVFDLVSGEIVETDNFLPNGARESLVGATTALNGDDVPAEPAGFTGKEADEEVGLTYFGQRYLVPRIGRWATPDPLSIHAVGGGEALNAFHYVAGNLLQARDPLGLDIVVALTHDKGNIRTMADGAKFRSIPAMIDSMGAKIEGELKRAVMAEAKTRASELKEKGDSKAAAEALKHGERQAEAINYTKQGKIEIKDVYAQERVQTNGKPDMKANIGHGNVYERLVRVAQDPRTAYIGYGEVRGGNGVTGIVPGQSETGTQVVVLRPMEQRPDGVFSNSTTAAHELGIHVARRWLGLGEAGHANPGHHSGNCPKGAVCKDNVADSEAHEMTRNAGSTGEASWHPNASEPASALKNWPMSPSRTSSAK